MLEGEKGHCVMLPPLADQSMGQEKIDLMVGPCCDIATVSFPLVRIKE